MSDKPTNEDPCDSIDLNYLEGWTQYDSDGMRKKDHGEGLERSERDRRYNSWARFDHG